mmetsp:Transcript_109268/g.319881  ORF Transcript_109268/g.319881 Transcript_109268/m.319881 type:complete len:229 (-) Transcript_109268:399-1085(-)
MWPPLRNLVTRPTTGLFRSLTCNFKQQCDSLSSGNYGLAEIAVACRPLRSRARRCLRRSRTACGPHRWQKRQAAPSRQLSVLYMKSHGLHWPVPWRADPTDGNLCMVSHLGGGGGGGDGARLSPRPRAPRRSRTRADWTASRGSPMAGLWEGRALPGTLRIDDCTSASSSFKTTPCLLPKARGAPEPAGDSKGLGRQRCPGVCGRLRTFSEDDVRDKLAKASEGSAVL